MPMTPKEMIRYLKNNPSTKRTVIVPVYAKSMKKGLEQAILKQAGLKLP